MDFAVRTLGPYTAPTVPRRLAHVRPPRSTLPGLMALALGCAEAPTVGPAVAEVPAPVADQAPPADECPASGVAPPQMPRTRPEHETLGYWLVRTAEVADLDRPVLTAAEVKALNARAFSDAVMGFGNRVDLRAPVDVAVLASGLRARLGFLRERFTTGKYVRLDGTPLPTELQARYAADITPEALAEGMRAPLLSPRTGPQGQVAKDSPARSRPDDPRGGARAGDTTPELRVALDLIPIYCGPQTEPYYTPSRDPEFDRNMCSMARPQEVVQVLRPWDGDLVLARTSYVVGWIDGRSAALSPPLAPAEVRAFLDGPYRRVGRDVNLALEGGGVQALPFASLVPRAPGEPGRVLVATAAGVRAAAGDDPALADSPRPLTRRELLTEAFAYLGQRYGWGDRLGGRDCSRYLMDLFAGLGVLLPRHTSDQALAGSYVVDVPPELPEPARQLLLDEHLRRGIVLLHFPGHIMLYLGRDADGAAMAIHSFAEYLVPCAGRPEDAPAGERETLLKVDGVHVSDLELGRGTSRTAFIQRITKITVLGPTR